MLRCNYDVGVPVGGGRAEYECRALRYHVEVV